MKNVLTGLFLLILATACSEEEPQTITPVPFNRGNFDRWVLEE